MKNCIASLNPWAAELTSSAAAKNQVSAFRKDGKDYPLFEYRIKIKSSEGKRPYSYYFREILQMCPWDEEGIYIKLEKKVRRGMWQAVPESAWEQPRQLYVVDTSIWKRGQNDPWFKHCSTRAFFVSGLDSGFLWNTSIPQFLNI